MRRTFTILALVTATVAPARAQMSPGMGGMGGGMGNQAPQRGPSDDTLPDVDSKIADDPEAVISRADADLAAGSWTSALAHYQHIRQRFSFNQPIASRALIGLGDVAFAREKWSEARSQYRSFLRFYPTHPKAEFAAFRVGLASYKDIPAAQFFLPPQYEKDQSEAQTALTQFRQFLESHPASEFGDEARRLTTECEDKLAAHELYVAEFNRSRGKWKGVVLRADTLTRKYPTSTLVKEALLLAVEAHAKLGDASAARDALARLQSLEPAAPEAMVRKATKLVEGIAAPAAAVEDGADSTPKSPVNPGG